MASFVRNIRAARLSPDVCTFDGSTLMRDEDNNPSQRESNMSGAEAVQLLSILLQCGGTEPAPDPAGAGDTSPVEELDQHYIVEESTGMLPKFH
ncbi:uncharacterized protein ANIA_11548 [Aspergillus nidulans FGSC A4]|uniref:Uncharacterized protein n=1 Tax=Emericella nidulans (strain FGSC A4 / ATCC 38163 / CBS 112.46 / NRRL 194 / M139) TaxID=227321 RepID=C8VD63_EMENI|nr:hypothetical protein [Aspergillus nidulans FGSC A4]CBF78953.1 TPA: hypothetical protein ANIA_11548 [Aspergillus nidulans FGSC A4]